MIRGGERTLWQMELFDVESPWRLIDVDVGLDLGRRREELPRAAPINFPGISDSHISSIFHDNSLRRPVL
ncbi:hypothetical protein U1Q18_037528 [Sarracenia purpurea var. burkii]